MRVYLNTSALNRPFDDLSSQRVRLEAEAVAMLMAWGEAGRIELVGSEYLEFEAAQNPDPERARRVLTILRTFGSRVRLSVAVARRARELERSGLRGLDALHVAAAEAGGVTILVTTDDRMRRRAERAGKALAVQVMGPTEALVWIGANR